MILLSVIIIIIYSLLIGSFTLGFDKVEYTEPIDIEEQTKFSIIIPFRNEVENLPDLLKSLLNLDYSKYLFEIIFVNDSSDDRSVKVIEDTFKKVEEKTQNNAFDFKIINNISKTNSPKKDAITLAISLAKYDWIITTDADCIVPKFWLHSFNSFIQSQQVKCIVAPVTYHKQKNFLERFQTLDFISLQGVTIGSFGINKPFLCNGANFAYEKNIFYEVNGFESNTHIASGDDIFLLEKIISAFPTMVKHLKSPTAIVKTKPQHSWASLFSQRVRWASKTSHYNSFFAKLVGLISLMTNALVAMGFVLAILSIFPVKSLGYLLIIKFCVDFLLIYKTAVFFNQKEFMLNYPLSFLLYPFFSTYVAFLAMFKNYKWKGRFFSK